MSAEEESSGSASMNLTQAQRNLLLNDEDRPPLYKFVFTGGPCGGKTTALARVFSFLRERNFQVINCPEAYTLLNSNGTNDPLVLDKMAGTISSSSHIFISF